jgi:hypothetical protein
MIKGIERVMPTRKFEIARRRGEVARRPLDSPCKRARKLNAAYRRFPSDKKTPFIEFASRVPSMFLTPMKYNSPALLPPPPDRP